MFWADACVIIEGKSHSMCLISNARKKSSSASYSMIFLYSKCIYFVCVLFVCYGLVNSTSVCMYTQKSCLVRDITETDSYLSYPLWLNAYLRHVFLEYLFFFNQVSIPESCVHENALATSPVWHDWTTHPSSPWFQMSLMCASYYQYNYFLVNSIRNVVYRCPFGQTWCTSVSIDEDMGRTSAMSLQSTYMMSKVDCYFEIGRYVTNKLPSGRVIFFLFSKYNYSEIDVFERMTITNPIYVIQNVNEWVCVFS